MGHMVQAFFFLLWRWCSDGLESTFMARYNRSNRLHNIIYKKKKVGLGKNTGKKAPSVGNSGLCSC